jgi:hypothetical protein
MTFDAATASVADLAEQLRISSASDGLAWGADAHVLRTRTKLADGTTGWHMQRWDDCWRCAVATCLSVPVERVPDPRIDERLRSNWSPEEINRRAWSEFHRWLETAGCEMVIHDKLPTHLPRWIGLVLLSGSFASHTLVMSRRSVLFDPNQARNRMRWRAEDVGMGFSFKQTTRR